jgi:hypothetical protein
VSDPAAESGGDSPEPPGPTGFRILDLAGLVVGYGLVSVLVRSYWREVDPTAALKLGALGLLFLWGGLAMSGPFVLLLERRGPAPGGPVPTSDPPSRYTRDESAWLAVGAYLVAVTYLVVASGVFHERKAWSLTIQVLGAVLFVLWLQFVRTDPGRIVPRPPRWTRIAARLVLLTWPVAWAMLIWLVW